VGTTGPTVGQAVSRAFEAGEELPSRLECLGHGLVGALGFPQVPKAGEWLNRKACQAYHQGFLDK
jgi:hypothetical protein